MNIESIANDIRHVFPTAGLLNDEIAIALNRVITRINVVYKGSEELTGDLSSSFDTTDDTLTIDDDYTKVQEVYVSGDKFTNVSRVAFLNYSTSDKVVNVIGNKIYFKADYSGSEIKCTVFNIISQIPVGDGVSLTTPIEGKDTKVIDLPTVAYEVLFVGAVYSLASNPKYYDKLIYEEYRNQYYTAFKDFEYIVDSREPHKQIQAEYSW